MAMLSFLVFSAISWSSVELTNVLVKVYLLVYFQTSTNLYLPDQACMYMYFGQKQEEKHSKGVECVQKGEFWT